MLSKEEMDLYGSLMRLRYNADYKVISAYLEDYLDKNRITGDRLISPEKEWNQGWNQALSYVLGLVNEAERLSKKGLL